MTSTFAAVLFVHWPVIYTAAKMSPINVHQTDGRRVNSILPLIGFLPPSTNLQGQDVRTWPRFSTPLAFELLSVRNGAT